VINKKPEIEMSTFSIELEESFLEPSLQEVGCPLNSPDGLAKV